MVAFEVESIEHVKSPPSLPWRSYIADNPKLDRHGNYSVGALRISESFSRRALAVNLQPSLPAYCQTGRPVLRRDMWSRISSFRSYHDLLRKGAMRLLSSENLLTVRRSLFLTTVTAALLAGTAMSGVAADPVGGAGTGSPPGSATSAVNSDTSPRFSSGGPGAAGNPGSTTSAQPAHGRSATRYLQPQLRRFTAWLYPVASKRTPRPTHPLLFKER